MQIVNEGKAEIIFDRFIKGKMAACVKLYHQFGERAIVFPQNFKPEDEKKYEVILSVAGTGKFVHRGVVHRVVKAFSIKHKYCGKPVNMNTIRFLTISTKAVFQPFKALKNFKAARIIEEELPIKAYLPYADKLKVESKIIRPVKGYNTGRIKILDIAFSLTEKGTYLFKAVRYKNDPISYYTDEWLVGDPKLNKAVVCFCCEKIPNNWIYFKVTSIPENSKCVFVKPISGTSEELLSMYKYNKSIDSDIKVITAKTG